MRLDKWLKVSRLIRRRTVANEVCDAGRVAVNGRTAKPGAVLEEGDVVTIAFGAGPTTARVLSVRENVRKGQAAEMYEIVEESASARAVRSAGDET
jgi:ribosomal 50S subunit-recycling heat shock protein